MPVQEITLLRQRLCKKLCVLSKTIFSIKRYRENELYVQEQHTREEALMNV